MNKNILIEIITQSLFLHPLEKEEYILTLNGEILWSPEFKEEFYEFLRTEFEYWEEYNEAVTLNLKQEKEKYQKNKEKIQQEKKDYISQHYTFLKQYLQEFKNDMSAISTQYEKDIQKAVQEEDLSEIEKIRSQISGEKGTGKNTKENQET